MTTPISLTLTGEQHAQLKRFLFPGDGCEAVAVILCGRRDGDIRHRLLAREIHEVPYEACSVRSPVQVTWPTDAIEGALNKAEKEKLSVLKIHGHPNGYPAFSATDDASDAKLMPAIRAWVEADVPHGSLIMLPDGQIFGRAFTADGMADIHAVNVVGDNLDFWYADKKSGPVPDFAASHAQIFDTGTIERMQRLSVAVVGVSGTGSPVVEQLVRLGVGEIVLVDDDQVEKRNVNRIINSTMEDAARNRAKVDVVGDAVERIGLGTKVVRVAKSLWHPDVVRRIGQCDIVFGCMDTIDGRYLLNMLATFYLQPYFDIGIRLDTHRTGHRQGQVREVCGTVHYLQPSKSSLLSRGLFTMADIAAAGIKRNDPAAHQQQVDDGYIKGVAGHRPAVISVNMLGASLAVNEFLARLHPYREEPNSAYAAVTFSLASMEFFPDPEEGTCVVINPYVGKGDVRPLLRMPELSDRNP